MKSGLELKGNFGSTFEERSTQQQQQQETRSNLKLKTARSLKMSNYCIAFIFKGKKSKTKKEKPT